MWLVGLQAASAVLVVLAVLALGAEQSISAFLGGVVVIGPNAWFAWMTRRTDQAAGLLGFALIKFVLVAVGAGLVLAWEGVAPLGFFIAFAVALIVQVVGPFWVPQIGQVRPRASARPVNSLHNRGVS